jgi:hypothetical protein
VGKRSRRQGKLSAASSDYTDSDGNVLTLRGSLSPGSRRQFAALREGGGESRAAASLEDSWQRALELLFEQLAVRWVIAGAPIERQKELLARFRVASGVERSWVRGALRDHCAEYFPDVDVP